MATFETADDVYGTIGKLFTDAILDESMVAQMRRANTTVQYEYSGPDATITVAMIPDAPPQVDLGLTNLIPEVTVRMTSDVANRYWLGKVNITTALARGEINARGPNGKILALVPLVKSLSARYQAQLEEAGRTDLVGTA